MDANRRRFLGMAAMTIAGTQLGLAPDAEASDLSPIDRGSVWINSPRLTAAGLQGKVVLVDFWTFTCINWLRTLPYVRAWAHKYKDRLVVVGVHTPEFPFEHDADNVRRNVQALHVDYPVVIDSSYAIWRGFDNNYWPALYFIDHRGRLRHRQFGEGEYDQSERTIQKLLADAGAAVSDAGLVSVNATGLEAAADWGNLKSPENYLGHDRSQNFASPTGVGLFNQHVFKVPAKLALNQWALAGDWAIGGGSVVANAPGGRIVNRFHARDFNLVMGPSRRDQPVRFRVSIDGHPPGAAHGLDVDEQGNGTLAEQRVYQLIRHPMPIVDRQLEIEFVDAGAEAFSFTFG